RRDEVAERLADAGARLEEADTATVVEACHGSRVGALPGSVFVAAVAGGNGTVRAKVVLDRRAVEPDLLAFTRHLDDHVHPRRVVVGDGEADAIIVHPRGDL